MPNLYFCQSSARGRGMLRAVLSREDCKHVVQAGSATYVGEQFPAPGAETSDFAVLMVDAEEADAHWRSGFYRLNADLMEINAQLLKISR